MGENYVTDFARIPIHSFGLGPAHTRDTMFDISTLTIGTYTYARDWTMLRECFGGCLGSLQSTSHQNVRLKLRLPEGSTAKIVKVSGALQSSNQATGHEVEAALGDLRFGDKRDILVQLAIAPDVSTPPQDPWETIVSELEAVGGLVDQEEPASSRPVEELPLLQAHLSWGDILHDCRVVQSQRPSLLAITMLPSVVRSTSTAGPSAPIHPSHPSIVQRRMELLTSDMLTRAVMLASRGHHDRARHLLTETRSILRGLAKGGLRPPPSSPSSSHLPPVPAQTGLRTETSSPAAGTSLRNSTPPPLFPKLTSRLSATPGQYFCYSERSSPVFATPPRYSDLPPLSPPPTSRLPPIPKNLGNDMQYISDSNRSSPTTGSPARNENAAIRSHRLPRTPSLPTMPRLVPLNAFVTAAGIDIATVNALDAELDSALQGLVSPLIFDSENHKAVLQAVDVISSQRGCNFRTPAESLWAARIPGVRRLASFSQNQ